MDLEGDDEKSALMTESESPRHRCRQALTVEWKLVLYKIQYFFLMGAEAVDRVFFKLLLKESGMSTTQIGIIAGISPFFAFFSNVTVSTLANKYRMGKAVLLVSSSAAAAVGFAIAVVPLPMIITKCTMLVSPTNTSSMDTGLLTNLSWLYEEADLVFTFYVLLALHVALWILRALSHAFTDVALVSYLGESGMPKYACQKSFGALGGILFELGTGAVVAITIYQKMVCDLELTFSDYQVAYYIVGAAMAVCFLVSCTFRLENGKEKCQDFNTTEIMRRLTPLHTPQTSDAEGDSSNFTLGRKKKRDNKKNNEFSLKNLLGTLLSVHYVSWIVCIFYVSLCQSISTYSYLYLDKLGADALLIGVVGGVTSGSDFIFYLFGFWIVQKLGTINSLYFSLIMQAVRFSILAVIIDPRLGLLAAVLDGCTLSMAWVAIIQHASDGFPKAYTTTVIGIIHGTFFGVGIGTGQLVGGVVIDAIGARYTFATFAGVTLIFTAIFCLVQKLSKQPSFDESQRKPETIRRSDFGRVDKSYETDS